MCTYHDSHSCTRKSTATLLAQDTKQHNAGDMTKQRPHKNSIFHINKGFHIYERCEVS